MEGCESGRWKVLAARSKGKCKSQRKLVSVVPCRGVRALGTSPPAVSWSQRLCWPSATTLLEAFYHATLSVSVSASCPCSGFERSTSKGQTVKQFRNASSSFPALWHSRSYPPPNPKAALCWFACSESAEGTWVAQWS